MPQMLKIWLFYAAMLHCLVSTKETNLINQSVPSVQQIVDDEAFACKIGIGNWLIPYHEFYRMHDFELMLAHM